MNKQLTEGSILKSIILFSLPLIAGNLLQQLYNVVDTFVVGQYIGADALASVGTTYSIVTFLTSIILGLCMGAGVLFSMLYGGQRLDDMKVSMVLSFVAIGLMSLVIMVMTLLLMEPLLIFLNVPDTIYDMTCSYLTIICYGILFTFLYNYFASFLRALGDSKTPFWFLGLSTVMNIVLDIVFVQLYSDVKSVAYATIIAQGLSALLMMGYTLRKKKMFLPTKVHCHYNQGLFKQFLSYSLLTSLQQSVMNFGIMMVQGLVNSFGVSVMAGFSTAVKIDTLAYMPVQDFGNAFSTFIAQNTGAKQHQRIKKGLRLSVLLSSVFCIIISLIIYVYAKDFMLLFLKSSEVEAVQIGVSYLHIEGMCYVGIGILFLWYGYFRGLGKPLYSIILTVISLGTRVVLAYYLSSIPSIGVIGIWWSIPIGWFLADLVGLMLYFRKSL